MDDFTDYDDELSSYDLGLTQGEAEEQAFEELAATPSLVAKWLLSTSVGSNPVQFDPAEADFWDWSPAHLLAVVMTGRRDQAMTARWELQRQFQRVFQSEISERAQAIWARAHGVREAA